VIASLYNTLLWYNVNRGSPVSSKILNLFELWKNLHAMFVNISDEGWRSLKDLAEKLNITMRISREDEKWLFLYALETYLNILMRVITLSKLGRSVKDLESFRDNIYQLRNIFEHNVFEWIFDASYDKSLQQKIREDLRSSINLLLEVVYNLDLFYVSFDMFREFYQNILPREVRKSLGEFYTNDDIVNKVLDAAGLDRDAIRNLYERWRRGEKDTIILDPACGSGSFLVNIIKRIFSSFDPNPPRDIAKFIEENIVGVDINPFAVEMAKLNMIMTISSEMIRRGGIYTPSNLRILWADSLAKTRVVQKLHYLILIVNVPTLRQIINRDTVNIPYCSRTDPLKILDEADKYVQTGADEEKFVHYVTTEICSSVPKNMIEEDLREFFRSLKNIYESGNSRIISMIRNVIAVQSLIERCSYVIGNPPWVRIHNLGRDVINYLRNNYKWFGERSSYSPGFRKTVTPFPQQFDYSVAFVERGLEFLRDEGVLSYVITSKIIKTTYAGKMREDLVKEYTLLTLIDYSLYPISLFEDVVNYPLVIAIKKNSPQNNHEVMITLYNTVGDSRSFKIKQKDLPLYSGTNYPNSDRSPWVLAPQEIISAIKKIMKNSYRLGDLYEVMMGIKTSLNEGYIGTLENCIKDQSLIIMRLEKENLVKVESDLVHPFVKGRDVDPLSFNWSSYIIFPHDTSSFEPLWDNDQREVLRLLDVLRNDVKVSASGGVITYRKDLSKHCMDHVESSIKAVENKGYIVSRERPCAVDLCLDIKNRDGRSLLKINISITSSNNRCSIIYHVSGLTIPNAPHATKHFTQLFEKLVKRDDYRTILPPWAIFRVSKDKFKEYRIAWQEIAKYIEATYLPLFVEVDICGRKEKRLLIPDVTTYFIIEEEISRALKLLIYLNLDFTRSLIKLWAWTARGGYYRHNSYNMGALLIPQSLMNNSLWSFLNDYIKKGVDLNYVARRILEEHKDELRKELIEALGITEDEYMMIVEYGEWLNRYVKKEDIYVEEEEYAEGE